MASYEIAAGEKRIKGHQISPQSHTDVPPNSRCAQTCSVSQNLHYERPRAADRRNNRRISITAKKRPTRLFNPLTYARAFLFRCAEEGERTAPARRPAARASTAAREAAAAVSRGYPRQPRNTAERLGLAGTAPEPLPVTRRAWRAALPPKHAHICASASQRATPLPPPRWTGA